MRRLPAAVACLLVGSIAPRSSRAWAQETLRVSVAQSGGSANGHSVRPGISSTGRFVLFWSSASDLVPGDTNGSPDVFVRDLQLAQTERVNVDSSGNESNGEGLIYGSFGDRVFSADGRFVVWSGVASDLAPGDVNSGADVFLRDRALGQTLLVGVTPSGIQGNGACSDPSISDDGRYVAFVSSSTDLVPQDTNGSSDVFVRDVVAGVTTRASTDATGIEADAGGSSPSISADGRRVAFLSGATNLVASDTNGFVDVFVKDLDSGQVALVSVGTGGTAGNHHAEFPSLSGDGDRVSFHSLADNLVQNDTNAVRDVFLHRMTTGETSRASVTSSGQQANLESRFASLSWDGRFVVFQSAATNLVPGDTNGQPDAFVRDVLAGSTERASVSTLGVQANDLSMEPGLSADGRYAVFFSLASNLVSSDANVAWDVFRRDRGPIPVHAWCAGDGATAPCPCGNLGLPGRGCENSASTGGALLTAAGAASLSVDSLTLTSSGQLSAALGIVLQGSAVVPPVAFGDGLRCIGGSLRRLYVKTSVAGVVTAPEPGDPPVSARSAALGDPLGVGMLRLYQVYYRDPDPAFCARPVGSTFNSSSALGVTWEG